MFDKLIARIENLALVYRDVYVEANARVEATLRERLSEKDQVISDLRAELAQCRGKLERMELAIMPLSSAAGANYVRGLNPSLEQDRRKLLESARNEPVTTNWQRTLADHISKMQQEDEAEAKAKAHKKEN